MASHVTADHRDGLALAVEAVRRDNPPPLDPATHPMAFAGLGELLDQRDQQQKEADTAA